MPRLSSAFCSAACYADTGKTWGSYWTTPPAYWNATAQRSAESRRGSAASGQRNCAPNTASPSRSRTPSRRSRKPVAAGSAAATPPPGPYREYLALEQAASDIFAYDPQHIPDLLQTPQYAQAATAAVPSLPADTTYRTPADLLLSRQQVLGKRRPRLTALIGETALRQGTGGRDVMRDQLRALAAVGGRVVVQVLPSGCEPSSGPVTILRFAGVPSLGAVYLPGLSGGLCLAGQQDVASYTRAFEYLRASALTPAASAGLIREIAAG
jgi:hypothetical protein